MTDPAAVEPQIDADYVIVGAGAAGSVVARRLVDAGRSVVILEAGPADDRDEIADPLGSFALFGSDNDWAFSTVPQAEIGDRTLYQPRGKSLGGSTILNGMLYVRGSASDYDGWADAGASGWSWSDVEPYFRKLEAFDGPNPGRLRGTDGPTAVQHHPTPDPLSRAFVDSAVLAGAPFVDDYNAGDSRGASFTQSTIHDGRRVTAWRAYVGPVARHPNLVVITGSTVVRIVVKRGRATGVEFEQEGRRRFASATSEVILTAGVFGSPHLLLLSGIGPKEELEARGISTVLDLPGVGKNLRDHVASPVIWEGRSPVPPPTTSGVEAHVISDGTADALVQPDRQSILVGSVFTVREGELPAAGHGFTALAMLLHPRSAGTVSLQAADPHVPPAIDPAVLSDPRDVDSIVAHIRFLRAVAGDGPLSELIAAEVQPGPSLTTDEQLREYVRASLDSGHHQVGTARMGSDRDAVVDSHLRLRGIDGLRVADASVMPLPPAGNTVGPVLMIGERAADFILADASA